MVIPCGRRLGICIVTIQEYWLRVAAAMADYIGQGRGTRVPLPNHHAHPVETMTLSPPTQIAISYADRQNLGFAEWYGPRDGWILYSTKFPSGCKESVKVVEERLKLDSKKSKGGKKVDSGKGDSSSTPAKQKPKSAAKTSSRRPKVAMDRSIIPPSELGDRSPIAPGTSKKSAVRTSKSRKKLNVGSPEEPVIDPPIPLRETVSYVVQEKSTPIPAKVASKSRGKSAAVPKKAKGKPVERSADTPSSPDGESPVVSAIPAEEGSAIPVSSSTICGRTRSKRKAAMDQAKSKVHIHYIYASCHYLLHEYKHCPMPSYLSLFSHFFFFFVRPIEGPVVRLRALIGPLLLSR